MTIVLTSNVDIKNLCQVLHDTMEGRDPDDIGGSGAKFPAGPFIGGKGPPLVTGPPGNIPFKGGRGVLCGGGAGPPAPFIKGGRGPEVEWGGG